MNDKKNGAQPVPDFSVFDGQRLLGLDRLGLRARSMRFLGRGDGSGVWQIRCAPRDESAHACISCGCMCRVRTSRERTVVHVPLGSDAIHLKVRVRSYECVACARMWHDDLGALASGRTLLSRAAVD